jgi:hypothetical protein
MDFDEARKKVEALGVEIMRAGFGHLMICSSLHNDKEPQDMSEEVKIVMFAYGNSQVVAMLISELFRQNPDIYKQIKIGIAVENLNKCIEEANQEEEAGEQIDLGFNPEEGSFPEGDKGGNC